MESIHKRPTARQIQPIGFLGCLEAIRAPTRGNGMKGTRKMNAALPPPVPQVVGGCTDRVRIYNTTPAAHRTSESAASDQASQVATRAPPSPRPCCLAASITALLYMYQRLPVVTAGFTRLGANFLELRQREVRSVPSLRPGQTLMYVAL